MNKSWLCILAVLMMTACAGEISIDETLDQEASLFPDYKEVTIPVNIAPLNLQLLDVEADATCLLVEGGEKSIQVRGDEGSFSIPEKEWKELLRQQVGAKVKFTPCVQQNGKWMAYRSFTVDVVADEIDSYLVYRLVAPGYALWDKMGIYQRNLETFEQTPIYENKQTEMNCQNCHSFQMQNPQKMIFHMRAWHGGTVLVDNGHIEKLNTGTSETISGFVYPHWHPTADYVAYSNNIIGQTFFMNHANRLEGFDADSDILVYNTKTHEAISSPLIKSPDAFETYPIFSPDGKSLYFCSTAARKPMPERYKELHYDLCRIDFNAEKGTFGTRIDTVYNASRDSLSVSFPRVSPDGKYIVMVRQKFGQWAIWHKDADLVILDIQTGKVSPMTAANSEDAESYHSWSHNSRWMVFSSRRDDGLYTKPYFTYIDVNGVAHKPFLLPQKNPKKYYDDLLFSYNIPELVQGPVQLDAASLADKMRTDPGINVSFRLIGQK